jgi:hypothetical protein
MYKTITFLSILLLTFTGTMAQTTMKEHKAGQVFYVSLPSYMNRTMGLNSASTIQYKSVVKDVYGFVIVDGKQDLDLAELKFASINEFYEHFIDGFLADQEKREVSKPVFKTQGDMSFVESDVTYFDKDADAMIYYLVGIVETKSSYYKVLSWSSAVNKDKFKADFQKILYSLKD